MPKRMATRGVHIETKIVFETGINMWTRLRRIKMQRCIVRSCETAFVFAPLRRLILTWHFSWHYVEMKEDAFQKGLPVPDEAAVRDRILKKHVDPPDLVTVKDFPPLLCGHELDVVRQGSIGGRALEIHHSTPKVAT